MRAGEAGSGGVTFSFTGGVWHGCGGNVLRDVATDGFGGGGGVGRCGLSSPSGLSGLSLRHARV